MSQHNNVHQRIQNPQPQILSPYAEAILELAAFLRHYIQAGDTEPLEQEEINQIADLIYNTIQQGEHIDKLNLYILLRNTRAQLYGLGQDKARAPIANFVRFFENLSPQTAIAAEHVLDPPQPVILAAPAS